jgi:hypothetical protein
MIERHTNEIEHERLKRQTSNAASPRSRPFAGNFSCRINVPEDCDANPRRQDGGDKIPCILHQRKQTCFRVSPFLAQAAPKASNSPGASPTIWFAGTRLSEHPIQTYFDDCCRQSSRKYSGLTCRIPFGPGPVVFEEMI